MKHIHLYMVLTILSVFAATSFLVCLSPLVEGTIAYNGISGPALIGLTILMFAFTVISIVGILNLLISYKIKLNKLEKEFEQYKKESIKWGTYDFISCGQNFDPPIEISEEMAQYYLELMIEQHDCNNGITWSTVEDYLYNAVNNGDAYQ